MKQFLLSLVAIAALALSSFGQSPEGFKYQAVVRDAGNLILSSQAVGMQLTIQQGSIGGTAVYTETFAPTTNAYGLVNLEIGSGTSTDDFSTIDWANGPYFMETAVDVTGGTSYSVMGTSQLMSVPYALYANTSGNGAGPAGADGNDGSDGAVGATGPQGPQGNIGSSGDDGAVGATGPQGPQGNIGSSGDDGIDGTNGSDGNDGPAGADGIGIAQTLLISGDTLFISSGNYILIPGLSLINSLIAEGCMDPTAFNYDASANTDDGSCIAVVNGCTDPTAFNYNASANTDDGSCIAVVNGCMDPTALNYDASANTDDGSCIAVVNGCTDPSAFNYDASANTDDGSCIAVVNGCMDPTAFNYNASANTDDGSCSAVVNGCTDPLYAEYDASANTDDGSCATLAVNGCTDPTALNYNALANTDDGSCIFLPANDNCATAEAIACGGSSTGSTSNATASGFGGNSYNGSDIWYSLTGTGNGITVSLLGSSFDTYLRVYDACGGTLVAFNDDAIPISEFTSAVTFTSVLGTDYKISCGGYQALTGDVVISVTCVATVNGCTDPTAVNYDALANADDGSCIVNGCTDPLYTEYDASANTDDGSCTTLVVNGCTDPTALNYNALANTDDGSCIFVANDNCATAEAIACGGSSTGSTSNATASGFGGNSYNGRDIWYSLTGTGDLITVSLLGSSFDTFLIVYDACGGTEVASNDDASGIGLTSAVTFTSVLGTDYKISCGGFMAQTGDVVISVTCVVLGCTDPTAFNYDASANTDDGSCIAVVNGCTDPTAFNYDASANTDDGSCVAVVNGCTDPTALNYEASANTDDGSCIVLAIGDTYQGGIIFYLDGNGGGLIAAPTDQSSGAEWGCAGTQIFGADGPAVGNGAQNTIDIVNANCSPYIPGNSIAANICANLTLGGYSDWFLPSKDELSQMFLNIGSFSNGFSNGFSPTYYWSSTDFDIFQAWRQRFIDGAQNVGPKSEPIHVRAVRAF